ncbi:hypothetical protein TBR22_A36030 [Luteitalea sp. TBR-22]|uniref:hypothetical protein n=1 Tax=Luteitalea sp. TBR-22 TaxID=2802971 RepID=UPI001AF4EC6E|nr:hypothetical protein [Luteitalea sp. TBR-22]BCS34373.1 hypothetical protein TBR22_A36030 [Luteitalea sp. TBR-22]
MIGMLWVWLLAAQAAVVPGPMATPPGWMQATRQAEALAKDGKAMEAADIYEKYSATQPWFPAAHYLRVELLLSAGRRDLVPPALATARANVPRDAAMREEAAMFLKSAASRPGVARPDARLLLDEAKSMLDEVLKTDPRARDVLTQKAAVLEAYAEHVETSAPRRKALQAEADALRERAYAIPR